MSHGKKVKQRYTLREKTWLFFDQPQGFLARIVQATIIALIFLSVGAVLLELIEHPLVIENAREFYLLELVTVIVFSAEYLLRLWASPSRPKFVMSFYGIIDLLAILPFFLAHSNLGFIRSARILRLLRMSRLLRAAKILRPLWDISGETGMSVARIVQENVFKNIAVLVALFFLAEPMQTFLTQTDPGLFGDITFASSIFVLAAMFGFFSLSYGDVNTSKWSNRMLMHITTAALVLPIGMMFLLIQYMLTIQIGETPAILVFPMWFVYGAVVLWDFANVLKVEEEL